MPAWAAIRSRRPKRSTQVATAGAALAGIADVGGQRDAAGVTEVVLLKVERHDPGRSLLEQALADRAPDPLGGAGDDGGAAREASCASRAVRAR